jgi:hypothetical protein
MPNNRVVYKVVTRNDRYSFSYFHWKRPDETNMYIFEYHKGKIVKAIKGTVGIMCFKEKIFAKHFMISQHRSFSYYLQYLMVIEVRPIGRVKHPRQISGVLTPVAITDFYKRFKKVNKFRPSDEEIRDNSNRLDRLWISNPPQGTVCYDEVEVLT